VSFSSVSLRQPVVKPLFGQLAEYETVAALGRRLGLKDARGKDFFRIGPLAGRPIENLTAWYEDYLSSELKNGGPRITLDELKRLPGAVWNDRNGTRYEKYREVIPPEKMATAVVDGTAIFDKPKANGGKRIGTMIDGVPRRAFFTPSGKVEFFSPWTAEKKDADGRAVDALPEYRPRDWQPTADYPLYLINWKEASHTHTRTQNNQWLLDIKPFAPLLIHPDTARRLGVREGDEVWVESPYGRAKAKAQLTRRMHPEVVGMQHGFGHWALGRFAKDRGSHMGFLNVSKSDPLSGQARHKEICVRIRPA
jgi:thiosulfate reductase/polysulfide reductase chain A